MVLQAVLLLRGGVLKQRGASYDLNVDGLPGPQWRVPALGEHVRPAGPVLPPIGHRLGSPSSGTTPILPHVATGQQRRGPASGLEGVFVFPEGMVLRRVVVLVWVTTVLLVLVVFQSVGIGPSVLGLLVRAVVASIVVGLCVVFSVSAAASPAAAVAASFDAGDAPDRGGGALGVSVRLREGGRGGGGGAR